jgi:hypothetical protein
VPVINKNGTPVEFAHWGLFFQERTMEKLKPIPANVAAIWGAFLYEGVWVCAKNTTRETEVLRHWNQGRVDLMAAVCAYLPEVWRQIEPRWYEAQFPGVFEYEVIAPLGTILGDYLLLNQGSLPPRDFVQTFVRDLIDDFFHSEQHARIHRHTHIDHSAGLH